MMADLLVVSKKVKQHIKEHGMNTSKEAIGYISDEVAKIAVRAVQNAKEQGRKTVMAKDVDEVYKELS